jgi:hypothetical protein
MKKRMAISVLTIAALFASSSNAFADAQSDYQVALQQYKTALANWNATNKADQENYKQAMKAWNDARQSADLARKAIAEKFKSNADAIKARTVLAVANASNAKEKKAANAAGKMEMDAAILDRNSALTAIAATPVKPVKPVPSPMPTAPTKPTPAAKPKLKPKAK